MTNSTDIGAMDQILKKLNAATNATDPSQASLQPAASTGDPDITAMATILEKLQTATNHTITEYAKTDVNLQMAIATEPTENGVTISRYDIRTEKQAVAEGFMKTMYHIIDNRTGNIIYDEICMFESAMGVVKQLLTNAPSKLDRIIELDRRYLGHMIESYSHKRKLRTLTEGSRTHDVSSAKYTMSRDKLATVKMKLLKAL